MIIGLTGRIGSGKSTFSKAFIEKYPDFLYLDSDSMIKELEIHEYWYDMPKEKYVDLFFNDKFFRNKVNADCAYYISEQIFLLSKINKNILLECATLNSSGLWSLCDLTIVVESLYEKRKERVLAKGYTEEFFNKIHAIQEGEFYFANITIYNTVSKNWIKEDLTQLENIIETEAK